jgi:SH3 domain protein
MKTTEHIVISNNKGYTVTVKIIALLFSLIFITGQAHSQTNNQTDSLGTRYIRDTLYVPLRSGQTTQHRIVHKGLVSGTRVNVESLSEDGTYSQVVTDQGLEGWIQTQYLSDSPAGKDLYEQAAKTITQLKASNATANQQLKQLQTDNKTLKAELDALTSNKDQLSDELTNIKSISANAIKLNSDNQVLLESNERLKNKVDILTTDNKRLQDEMSNDSFINGALAVLIGVFITLIVPRLWPKKRTEWS